MFTNQVYVSAIDLALVDFQHFNNVQGRHVLITSCLHFYDTMPLWKAFCCHWYARKYYHCVLLIFSYSNVLCREQTEIGCKVALLWYISDMNQSMSTFKRKLVDIEAALNALYFTTHLLEEKLQGNSLTGNNVNRHFHFTCINSTFDRNVSLTFLPRKPGFHKNKWYIFANVFPEAKMITLSAFLN